MPLIPSLGKSIILLLSVTGGVALQHTVSAVLHQPPPTHSNNSEALTARVFQCGSAFKEYLYTYLETVTMSTDPEQCSKLGSIISPLEANK